YIGSYYQPPDRISLAPKHLASPPSVLFCLTVFLYLPLSGVADALRTLQEKIRRLELERRQAERSYTHFFQDARKRQQDFASQNRTEATLPGTVVDQKLQSAEARCKVLEKQLDYMKKMVANVKKERNASLQKQQLNSPNNQYQQEKLEKLESEYLKLSKTQTLAEMKLSILEQKLLNEERERKLVQEKADEVSKPLQINLMEVIFRLCFSTVNFFFWGGGRGGGSKTPKQNELATNSLEHKKMPFVIGTSTSPSHSVHANVQSILHMMKHHQPQLCERVSALQRCGCSVKKNLHTDFSDSVPKPGGTPADQSLTLLSDLLLALQDELGQMSFDYQELERQIAATGEPEQREDLQKELERLTTKMEEKGAQITKLRKHQQMVHKLSRQRSEESSVRKTPGIKLPVPLPVQDKQKAGRKGVVGQKNLQLLRETQKFRNSLKQDDLSWET
uniref:Centrosomal protein 57kDa-like protein 1 n=1 Tax=Poecilia reticulata TaxID=8081 RepID=A0A3P9NBS7_POERE